MNIAMIGQKGMPAKYGGVERHVHDLSVGLVQAGHSVTVYSRLWYTEGKDGLIEGVNIVHTPSVHTKHLDTISHVLASTVHAMLGEYDVIHYHGIGPSLLSFLPRIFRPSVRVITTFHSIDRYHDKWNWFAKFVLRLSERTAYLFAHKTISVSQSLQQYCRNEYKKETMYIPNGVSKKNIKIDEEILSKFGLVKGQYFVMVSRLVPHKGVHILIEAFQKLKDKYNDDPVINKLKLAVVGGSAYTDNYVRALHLQAAKNNDVVFTDFQSGDALDTLYASSTALVHPSLNEGLPLTVLEAMNMNVPVLVSDIPEHLELIRDPRLIFAENNVDALLESLYTFLNMGSVDREEIVSIHKKRIVEEYSWDVLVPKIIEVYEDFEHVDAMVAQGVA